MPLSRRTGLTARGLLASLFTIGVLAGGVLAGGVLAGGAAWAASGPHGTVRSCTGYSVYAIQRHIKVTAVPAECQGLSRAQVNQAAEIAIRQEAAGPGPKTAWRKRANEAAFWVSSLLSQPAAAAAGGPGSLPPASGSTAAGGPASRLGGISDMAVSVAALIAWLAVAGSGAYLLGSWLLSGGDLRRRRRGTAAPPGAIMTHAGAAIAGLLLWISFLVTRWAAEAWIAAGLLLLIAGLGISLVILGLPFGGPARTARRREAATRNRAGRPARAPVLLIAGHGIFAATTLFLVVLAAIGA